MAVPTELTIANMALYLIGEDRLDSIDEENSKNAEICREFLPMALRSMLEEHPWRFAQRRISIAPEVSVPAFGYTAQFVLPSDFVSVTEINGDRDSLYSVENGRILMDAETIELMYTSEIKNFGILSAKFALALSSLLASYLAYNVTGGKARSLELMGMYEKNLYMAIFFDRRTGLGVVESVEAGEGGNWLARN